MSRSVIRAGLAAMLLVFSVSTAAAQAYEAIGACKRNAGVLLACIVAEKIGDAVIESVVEKSVQEWWDYWQSGEGQSVGSSTGDATEPNAAEIAASGVDYRTLMQDLGDLVPGSPGSLSDEALVAELAGACLSTDRPICGEFRSYIQDALDSPCAAHADETACTADSACKWRFNICYPTGN